MKTVVLTLLFVLLTAPAFASICTNPTPQTTEKSVSIYYAGVFKAISVRQEKPDERPLSTGGALPTPLGDIYTVQPIQPYVGNQTEIFEVRHSGAIDVWRPTLNVPTLGVVFKFDNGELYFRNLCSATETLKAWKIQEPEKITPEFAAEKEKCAASGEELRFTNSTGFCDSKTKDFKKECSKDSECEGFCEVYLNEKEQKNIYRQPVKKDVLMPSFDKNIYFSEKGGNCSEWKQARRCYFTPGLEIDGQKTVIQECK